MHAIPLELQDIVAGIQDDNRRMKAELAALEAKLAAIQPWAEAGRQFMAKTAWIRLINFTPICRICERRLISTDGILVHPDVDDCPIPALLAELEAAP